MMTPIRSNLDSSSSDTLNILNLSAGQLCAEERAKLVNAILSNPETAALAKLGLRVASPAQQAASAFVSAANSHEKHNNGWWNARNLVTGACASFALAAIFSFSNLSGQAVDSGLAMNPGIGMNPRTSMNQAQMSDHFGSEGSFEGVVGSNKLELVDRFGGGGFETD